MSPSHRSVPVLEVGSPVGVPAPGSVRVSSGVAAALAIGAGALLGSIPFGLLIARAATGADVRKLGSGNIGATNVWRASGLAPALLTLALDAGKGAAAVFLARALVPVPDVAGGAQTLWERLLFPSTGTLDDWAGLAAVAGHMFSPWLGLRGGKGVATAAGALLVLSPAVAGVALAVFAATILLFRIVSLASILACLAAMILAAGPLRSMAPSFPVVVAICGLIVVRHHANIARILKGREPRIGRQAVPGGSG